MRVCGQAGHLASERVPPPSRVREVHVEAVRLPDATPLEGESVAVDLHVFRLPELGLPLLPVLTYALEVLLMRALVIGGCEGVLLFKEGDRSRSGSGIGDRRVGLRPSSAVHSCGLLLLLPM